MDILQPGTKKKVENLFLGHTIVSLILGLVAVVTPNLFEWFMVHHVGEKLALRDNTGDPEQKAAHTIIRMYGALILAQAWITWNARKITTAEVRRALVQAYAVCFAITTLAMLRAQLTGGGFSIANWLNILLFAGLTVSYSWFAFFERIAIFEGIGRATR